MSHRLSCLTLSGQTENTRHCEANLAEEGHQFLWCFRVFLQPKFTCISPAIARYRKLLQYIFLWIWWHLDPFVTVVSNFLDKHIPSTGSTGFWLFCPLEAVLLLLCGLMWAYASSSNLSSECFCDWPRLWRDLIGLHIESLYSSTVRISIWIDFDFWSSHQYPESWPLRYSTCSTWK